MKKIKHNVAYLPGPLHYDDDVDDDDDGYDDDDDDDDGDDDDDDILLGVSWYCPADTVLFLPATPDG